MAGRKVGNRSMSRRGRPKIVSGTCNLCSAPCSSCIHGNAGFTVSKSDESSDENSHGVVASQWSFSPASEASNLVSVNHDTSSEIAKSKEIRRSSGILLDGSHKDQDYMKVDSCSVLPKEVKSQSSHNLSSDHQARNIPGQGKVKEKSGAENNKDKKNVLMERSTHSDQSGRVGKSDENNLLSEPEESNTSAMSESESADSELLELDVKVCDICGDAGREDLLAICSGCSDGAEHTQHQHHCLLSYCMRVMLKKVPEGDWLCEECKFAEQAEKQKLETKCKREAEVNLNTESSSKRHTDKFEAASDAKRQAVEPSTGSPKRSVLPRLSALSREKSFKGLEKTSRKLAHHSSFRSRSSADTKSRRSTDSQLQSHNVVVLGDTSTNKICTSSDQISSEAKHRDELRNVDGLLRSREFREAGEKNKDYVGNRQRSDLLSGSSLSTTRNIREDTNKGNRLRAAVDAALRKKPSFGKNRGLEQSDLHSVSIVDSSCDKALKKFPLKVPVIRDWPVGLQGGHPNLWSDKQTTAVNEKQSMLAGAEAMAASNSVEPEVQFPSVKPVMKDLPVVAPTVLPTTSTIPEHEYIWQGDVEVQKGKNLSTMHNGMQAYLSTLASPMVVEMVNQFPVKVTLNEVPRLSTWPAQFQEIGPKEDNVALFFFAKDIESYEKNYKPLVDNMIQKDLALKGNLKGVELLIFSSNQLPQNCQRWNMLYFLWGVFRGKKENCSNPPKNTPLPASCILPNMGKAFSTRESHENPSNRETLTDCPSSRMHSCMKDNANEDEACCAIYKGKTFSVSYGDSGVVKETEEGEIGASPYSKDEKTSEPRTVNSSDMSQKVDVDGLNNEGLCEGPVNKKLKTGSGGEGECSSISRMDTSGIESVSRKSGSGPCDEEKIIKKKPDATKRTVFPLDLNDGKEHDDEMVNTNPR